MNVSLIWMERGYYSRVKTWMETGYSKYMNGNRILEDLRTWMETCYSRLNQRWSVRTTRDDGEMSYASHGNTTGQLNVDVASEPSIESQSLSS